MKEKTRSKCPEHPDVPHALNANFCVLCGAMLHDHATCNHCGADLDVRGPFCTHCGRRQTPEEPCCPGCKKKVSECGSFGFGVGLCHTCWGNRMRS